MARAWPGLGGRDLAKTVSTEMDYGWEGGVWRLGFGYAPSSNGKTTDLRPHVVAIDYGSKRNIFRNLVKAGAKVSVVRSEEHTSELQSLMRISYAVFCLKKKKINILI